LGKLAVDTRKLEGFGINLGRLDEFHEEVK
jgi:hypothetical protein